MLRNTRFAHAAAVVALLGIAVTAAPPPAHAGSYTYNTQQRQINAGVLIVQDANPGAAPTPNFDPYPFYILNQRADVKPAGWSIVNPMAPKIVTPDVVARWDAYALAIPTNPYGVTLTKHVYDIGLPVTQDMAPYWEVSLGTGTSVDDLRQFDILLLNVRGNIKFTAQQKELLRQYVDGGGQLLVETTQAAAPTVTDLFFNVSFKSGTFAQANLPRVGGAPGSPFRHPILTEPNILAPNELRSLGHSADFGVANFGSVKSVFDTQPDLFGLLTNVLLNEGSDPVIKAGQLGAGEVIMDTTASAHSINAFLGGYDVTSGLSGADPNRYTAPNSGPYCNSSAGGAIASGVSSSFTRAPIADMKFLVNVMSWSGVHSSENGGAHQNSVSTDVAAAAVRPTWNDVESATSSFTPAAPYYIAGTPGAAIFGHYVAVVDKAQILHVYDLIPNEDLDGDGLPDDGIVDLRNGAPYDELWRSPNVIPGASAPTIAAPPGEAPQVFVEAADGSVSAFDLVKGTNATIATPIGAAGLSYTALPATAQHFAPSPTFYDGKLYAGRADGTIAVYDYARTETWSFALQPDANNPIATQWVTGSPAIVAKLAIEQ